MGGDCSVVRMIAGSKRLTADRLREQWLVSVLNASVAALRALGQLFGPRRSAATIEAIADQRHADLMAQFEKPPARPLEN